MKESLKKLIVLFPMLALSACVTENYENDSDKPVIHNEASLNEMAMTRISLGLGYLKMGNTTQAKLNFEKAKRHAPKLIQVHTAFAHYYETVGEPDLAIEAYEEALSIDSEDPDTLNNYGVFLCRLERYDDAEKYILKAISIPSYLLVSQSYENLALCQLKDDRFAKAETYLEKAIQHNPSNANVYLQMVQLQYAQQDYKSANLYFKKYEKYTRRFSPQALALGFKIYEKQRKMNTAKNYASMLVKMFPNSYEGKQYILNGLDTIEADQLADRYKEVMKLNNPNKSKKRVVVLSPNSSSISKSKTATTSTTSKSKKTKRLSPSAEDKLAIEKAKADKLAAEKAEADRLAAEKAEANRLAAEKAEADRLATEKAEAEKLALEVAAANELAKDQQVEALAEAVNGDLNVSSVEGLEQIFDENEASAEEAPMEEEQQQGPIYHTVAAGENLFYISRTYNVKIDTLKAWNGLTSSKIIIGDKILVTNPDMGR